MITLGTTSATTNGDVRRNSPKVGKLKKAINEASNAIFDVSDESGMVENPRVGLWGSPRRRRSAAGGGRCGRCELADASSQDDDRLGRS